MVKILEMSAQANVTALGQLGNQKKKADKPKKKEE